MLRGGLPWWSSGKESNRQCKAHRFDPRSKKIPHAPEQLSPCSLEPGLYKKRSHPSETREDNAALARGMMDIFAEFGAIRDTDPAAPEAQALVQKLQGYITEHYYTCSDTILLSLSKMYDGGGSMTENIDKVGGPGTGEFSARAIAIHCKA